MEKIRCLYCNKLIAKIDGYGTYHISAKCSRCKKLSEIDKNML